MRRHQSQLIVQASFSRQTPSSVLENAVRDAGLEAAENCLGVAAGLLVALPAAARAYLYVLPKGSELTAPAPTPVGKARFVLRAHDGSQHRSIRVGTYKAASWQAGDDVLFIMHGTARRATPKNTSTHGLGLRIPRTRC